jgi:tetratricopeptide (TPR) repeat protein
MEKKMPDFRWTEKLTSDLSKLLKQEKFTSEKDLEDCLNKIVKKGRVPRPSSKNTLHMAQDIIYDAWESGDRKERIKLAYKALSISSDCADAYVILAEEEAKTVEQAKEFYQKGVEAGKRALGKEKFKDYKGHFWGIIATRPYMRARAGLAQCLWELGQYDEAIKHYREMLRLNPNDNQGIRYVLAACLADLQKFDELEKLLNSRGYKYDCGPNWLYAKALLKFVRNGDTAESELELKQALKANPYVPEYLARKRPLAPVLPNTVTVGGEDEAMCSAADLLSAWEKVPGAIEWLKEKTGIKDLPKVGRNEPCPCGSGRKFKKCCGRLL